MLQVLQGIKEVVVAIAAAATAFIAYKGLNTWRREHRGRTQYDTARQVLKDVYRFREAIRNIRHPVFPAAEISDALEQTKTPLKEDILDPTGLMKMQAAVYEVRWRTVSDALATVRASTVEAEAVLDNRARGLLEALIPIANELAYKLQENLREDLGPAERHELRRVIYEMGAKRGENPFTDRLEDAITAIEEFLRPYLR